MSRADIVPSLVFFQSYPDGSGAPAIVEVWQGRQAARFALDLLGGEPTCHGIGSGLSAYMTRKAAEAAKRLYLAKVGELGPEWRDLNRAMYSEG